VRLSFAQECSLLCNTDFESPQLPGAGSWALLDDDSVPCWNTTATDNMLEFWQSGMMGVTAYSGGQFAELNANEVSTLYQDFTVTPGASVQISFAHRSRNHVDTMSVSVGPTGGPFTVLGVYTAGTTVWIYNTLNYTFPNNNITNYSLRFNSIDHSSNSSMGNFLDAVMVSLSAPLADFSYVMDDELSVNFTDLSNLSTGNIVSWEWEFGDGNYSDVQNPNHTYGSEGTYMVKLKVKSAGGCEDSTMKEITFGSFSFYAPNAFTPNADNLNDEFEVKVKGVREFKMLIFDRWGNIVFESTDINKKWDGKRLDENEFAKLDVYVWQAVITDFFERERTYTGHVALIR